MDSLLFILRAARLENARWLAPELFGLLKSTDKGDVWSYGVLVWEVYSRAALPYSEGLSSIFSSSLMMIYLLLLSRFFFVFDLYIGSSKYSFYFLLILYVVAQDADIRKFIESGMRLESSAEIPDQVAELMKKCWLLHADQRPSMMVISDLLVSGECYSIYH
jgi:hypothetical protein